MDDVQRRQFEEHIQNLRLRLPEFLRLHDIPLDKNFLCVNPKHVHSKYTGSMSYDKVRNKVHCFGNCEENPNFDIYDMAGFLGHCTDFNEKVKYVESVLGVNPVSFKAEKVCFFNGNHNFLVRDGLITDIDEKGKPLDDYTTMISAGLYNIKKAAEYLEQRGILRKLATEFSIGYLAKFNFLGTDGVGLIIPGNKHFVSIRDISGNFKARYLRLGSGDLASVFNPDAIVESCESGRPVFVTEGELDALSVITAGGQAVAMRGKASSGFLKTVDLAIKKTGKKPVVVLACDNDDVGIKVNLSLLKELKSKGIKSYWFRVIYCGYKDVNDALVNAKDRFVRYIKELQNDSGIAKLNYYESNNALDIANKIYEQKLELKGIDTGFSRFNEALGGGLFPWIYILGAKPGSGKSTLALQIADNIAKSGLDVLYFGMEMTKEAIVSRNLSRQTLLVSAGSYQGDYSYAKTSLDIIKHNVRPGKEQEVYDIAYKIYQGIGYHMIPITGVFSGEEVYEKVKAHRDCTGVNPVVFVDYLQIMGNPKNLADKQMVDDNIKGLVPIVTDFKVPLFIISSFNRNGYDSSDMTAFNGSGGIESFADVLMVLTYAGSDTKGFSVEAEKNKTPRKMKVKFLKHRYGNDSVSVLFDYYAANNYFTDNCGKVAGNSYILSDTKANMTVEQRSVFVCK